VLGMFRDSPGHAGHGSNFRKVIDLDHKPNPPVSHGQGTEKNRKGSVRQILQTCKVRLLSLASVAVVPTFRPENKATEPVRRLS